MVEYFDVLDCYHFLSVVLKNGLFLILVKLIGAMLHLGILPFVVVSWYIDIDWILQFVVASSTDVGIRC